MLEIIIFHTDIDFDTLSVFRVVARHHLVELGLVGVLVHVPDGIVFGLDLGHSVDTEPEGDQSYQDQHDLEMFNTSIWPLVAKCFCLPSAVASSIK